MDELEMRASDHLRTLSICHYVYAGLSVLFSAFGLFYVGMGSMFGHLLKNLPQNGTSPPPPPEFFEWFSMLFVGIGLVITLGALTIALLCFLSARAMSQRRNRTLSLIVAGLACMTGMLGIALGVFTFIVLLKPETERLYAVNSPPA